MDEKSTNFSVRNQYIAAIIVNIMALSVGTSIGWASPSLPMLQDKSSPIGKVLNSDEISWVGSIFAVGALFGTLIFGLFSEKFGRFKAIFLTTIPEYIWWLIIIFEAQYEILIIGRFLSGLSAGGIFVLVPLYTSEISENQTRGTLGSFFIFAINLGTLLMFAVGAYLSYSISGILMLILPIVFVPMFYFLPETPQYLLKNGKIQEAEKSMKFLRGIEKSKETPDQIKKELLNLSQQNDENSENGKVSIIEELRHRSTRRGFIIGIVLAIVNQLCGCFAFINYTAEIFKQSGSSLSPNLSAIVVAVIQIFGSTCSTFAVGYFSRKVLYSLTCCGTIFGLLIFGSHGLLASMIEKGTFETSFDFSILDWVPIAALSFVIFIASIGLLPMTFIMISEILPIKIRSFGISICTAVLWTISFLLLRFFDSLVQLLTLPICMFIFSGFTFFGMIFVIIYVPETRNRTNDQIEKLLN